jgi:hypothetical protein
MNQKEAKYKTTYYALAKLNTYLLDTQTIDKSDLEIVESCFLLSKCGEDDYAGTLLNLILVIMRQAKPLIKLDIETTTKRYNEILKLIIKRLRNTTYEGWRVDFNALLDNPLTLS